MTEEVAPVGDVDRHRDHPGCCAGEPEVDELYAALEEQGDGLARSDTELEQRRGCGSGSATQVAERVADVVEPQCGDVSALADAVVEQLGDREPLRRGPFRNRHTATAPK
jgi:hypothetical protein